MKTPSGRVMAGGRPRDARATSGGIVVVVDRRRLAGLDVSAKPLETSGEPGGQWLIKVEGLRHPHAKPARTGWLQNSFAISTAELLKLIIPLFSPAS